MVPSAPERIAARLGRRAMSSRWVRRWAGPARLNDRGDALDPEVQLMLRAKGWIDRDTPDPSPDRARADLARGVRLVAPWPLRPIDTHAGSLPGPAGPLPVRTYRPPRSRATMVFFHGGGWAVGDLDTHDALCRRLALDAQLTVISVGYRLAPENPFPAGRDDALAAFDAVRARARGPVGVGGDSAGGNLAALVAQARPGVAWQLLIYPVCDLRRLTASYRHLGEGYVLERAAIDRYLRWYGAEPTDPLASPLLAPVGRAPAVVVTAGFDPLRDEGEQYAERLAAEGVPVRDLRFPGLVHGFANMDGLLPAADRALAEVLAALVSVVDAPA
jgi:acetyl esterase